MQKWSDPEDAWPICAGGFQKATRFDSGLNAQAIPRVDAAKNAPKSEEAPCPDTQIQINKIKFNMLYS
jgi:hypothetical protein